jgi:hypothetical protein
MVAKFKILGFHPIDIYCAWPFDMAQYMFTKYWKLFSPITRMKEEDMFGQKQIRIFLI